jgi:hypothetical protein
MTDNPCGPACWRSKLPGWAHLPQFVFRDACRYHDLMYGIGGTESERASDDAEFYHRMRDEIAKRPGIINRAWLRWWAWCFFRAVRASGSAYFNYNDDERKGAA